MSDIFLAVFDWVVTAWQSPRDAWQVIVGSGLKIVVVLVPLILGVAYFTYWERKILAWMHVRVGPNRVGWTGLLQPFADVIQMLLKEIVVPTNANRFLFLTAPILALVPAFAVWAVVPLSDTFVIADIDAGLLYVLALTSLGIYGIILAGWASNSKYAFLGAMRSCAARRRCSKPCSARGCRRYERHLPRSFRLGRHGLAEPA